MIAMQYSFPLPADYDMSIIHRRIADKGHLMDNFPHLIFKAYLHAAIGQQGIPSRENLYAPFYLWENSAGLNAFLCSPAFRTLVHDFGWPSVRTWFVWYHTLTPAFKQADYATREIAPLFPHTNLTEQQAQEKGTVQRLIGENAALAAVVGFEPATWTRVRFTLWPSQVSLPDSPHTQIYQVGHISNPIQPDSTNQ